jgi:2-polyprenyl-3-methyl-5-hydroxy-6-metoxy-1,4-benzoquinol methylase
VRLLDESEIERRRSTFDVVSAVEVIEHLPDPRGFIAYLASLVRVGGVVYVQTGNWEVIRRFPGTPYIMPEGHIGFFTPQRLRALYAEAGLQEAWVLNRSWYPWRWLPQAVKRYAPVAPFAGLARICAWVAPNYGQLPVAIRVK